ncbi:MAG: winged helix-turn-helix domain-containing protein [Verrucomicrobiota bacterium]
MLSPIRAALLEPAGHPVKTPGIGRLLERHGWRKVAPDTRHPRTHPAGMADWKNNS